MILAALSDWPLQTAYIVCLLVGIFYGLFAGVFSSFGGGNGGHAGDAGHGGDAMGHTDAEVAQMGHEPGAADSGMHMSPFSPVIVCIFLVAFGGVGLATMQFFHWQYASLAVAAPSGFVMAAITFSIFEKFFSVTQGSSEPAQREMIGKEAEVITPIPADGLGEVAYVRRGARFTAPARSETGTPIAGHAAVTVSRIIGNTFYVRPSVPQGGQTGGNP